LWGFVRINALGRDPDPHFELKADPNATTNADFDAVADVLAVADSHSDACRHRSPLRREQYVCKAFRDLRWGPEASS
jgi:hypothetical protein